MRDTIAVASAYRSSPFSSFVAMSLLGLSALGCTEAESRSAPDSSRPEASEADAPAPQRMIASGTTLTFVTAEPVSTETHQAGDRFSATLRAPVTDAEGETLIEAGTPSQWVVTESTTSDGRTLLAVALHSVRIDDDWVPVAATVTDAEIESDQADTGSETAAKVGVGAAAGALIGQIVGGDTESTLTGAGVGAAVGTAVALTTRDGSATLPAGSIATVQLDEPLVVS